MFGSHLNKMKTSEKVGGSGTEGKECATKTGPTWKLRKWTKGGGYTTVRGGGEGRGGDSQHRRDEEDGGEGVCNASEEGSSSGKECVTSSSTDNKKIRVKYCTANKLILLHICRDMYVYIHVHVMFYIYLCLSLQSANIGVELSALSKGINIKVLHSPQKKSLRSACV